MIGVLYELAGALKYPALLLFALLLSIGKGRPALDFLLSGLILWACEWILFSMLSGEA